MSKLSHNERLKLKATALDRLSTFVVATAFVIPLINVTMNTGSAGANPVMSLGTATIAFTWILPSLLLYWGAAEFLKGLRE